MDAYFETIAQTPVLITLAAVALVAYWFGKASGGPAPDRAQEQADIARATRSLTANQKMQIDAAIDARRKIEAIRIMRGATGLGLKQSKEAVDARIRERDVTDKA